MGWWELDRSSVSARRAKIEEKIGEKKAGRRKEVNEWLAVFRANEISIRIREKANGGGEVRKEERKGPTKGKGKRERRAERRITGWREEITARPALRAVWLRAQAKGGKSS